MARILWRSWSEECARFDFDRIMKMTGLKHQWVNGHEVTPNSDDVWLTGNGNDYRSGPFRKATIFAEPYIYARNAYDKFGTSHNIWDVRFTYNPEMLRFPGTKLLPVAGYWEDDGKSPTPWARTTTFGMVLAKKPAPLHQTDIGWIRAKWVEALRGKSFSYWGSGWDKKDPNYKGEVYLSDHKFLDSQRLLINSKFALVLDNSNINGYLTEKFWNALAAGCIPIYYGHNSIVDKVSADAFIYGLDWETVEDVIEFCESMSDEEWLRRKKAGYEFFSNDTAHSWESIFRQVDLGII